MENNEERIPKFSPSICLTHACNLNCVYCYQHHDYEKRMTFDVAKEVIDWIFSNVPAQAQEVGIDFIGGEPLLEFELIKKIYDYVLSEKRPIPFIFFATTNGTLLTSEMKKWFTERKNRFVLGLSLDGTKDTHDHNRSNSFDQIDIQFFIDNWPNQGVKMTLSDYSIPRLAENVIYLHSLGFKRIRGVNLAEGEFDWSDDKYISALIPQLKKLVDFYVENDDFCLNQMLDKHIEYCEAERHEKKKWCGTGTGCPFFDVDGKRYPCAFLTPMTFSDEELIDILKADYSDQEAFVDEGCFDNCYIYPICPTCSGANYLNNHSFRVRDKRRCRIQKLIALFTAELQARKIAQDATVYDDDTLFYKIESIKKIREAYLEEFQEYFDAANNDI